MELSITKYKLWHHRHADWQLDIHNLKTGECLLGSSHSESYARAEDAAKNLKKIRSYSQIEKLIEDDGLLFEKTAYYKQSK